MPRTPLTPLLEFTDVHVVNCTWRLRIDNHSLCRCNLECHWEEGIWITRVRDCTLLKIAVSSEESVLFHGLNMLKEFGRLGNLCEAPSPRDAPWAWWDLLLFLSWGGVFLGKVLPM